MQGQLHMLCQNSGIESGLFFGCIGVYLAADTFDGMDDLARRMMRRTFEYAMFNIVRHTVYLRLLIARTRTYHQTHICDRRRRPSMHDFDAIWQNMIKSLRIFLHIPKKSSNFAQNLTHPSIGDPENFNFWGERRHKSSRRFSGAVSTSRPCCRTRAALAELVDAPDLGSGSERSESSSLLCRTTGSIRARFSLLHSITHPFRRGSCPSTLYLAPSLSLPRS